MEEKTTTNEDNDTLKTPLINGRRESMELEQVSLETNADESIWLKILCFLGAVYPILRENGKCKCNWKTIGWSILPLGWTCSFPVIIIIFTSPSRSTFELVWKALLGSFIFFFLPLSLSYTRKRFSDAIVGEENRLYINTVAKRGLMLSATVDVIFGVSFGVINAALLVFMFLFFTLILCPFAVIIIRCLFLAHTSVTQVKTELLEMARGTEVEELQTKLLEISKTIKEASVGYLQVPFSVLFVLGMMMLVDSGILLYKNQIPAINHSSTIYVVLFGTAIVTPLWILTRIEKFYLWTLRELLHRNTVMPRTEQTNLLAKYDTIAPRASIFGIYITRGRVASIIIAIFGSIAPKIGIYLYHNITI